MRSSAETSNIITNDVLYQLSYCGNGPLKYPLAPSLARNGCALAPPLPEHPAQAPPGVGRRLRLGAGIVRDRHQGDHGRCALLAQAEPRLADQRHLVRLALGGAWRRPLQPPLARTSLVEG